VDAIARLALVLTAAPLLLLTGCELKENSPPPEQPSDAPSPVPLHRVDTVRIVDTVTVTRVDTVYVPETVVDLPATKGSTPASKAASRTAAGKVGSAKTVATKASAPTAATEPRVTKSSTIVPPPEKADPVDKADLLYLRNRKLMIPVPGVTVAKLPDNFREKRGTRDHAALDIMAPRGTPVLSADAGVISKIHTSTAGGLTLYLADPTNRYIYYYAHLDRYRQDIKEGEHVEPGDLLGYVGTTGNAPPNAPHLHFAIGRMDDEHKWWKWTPIDPRPLLSRVAVARK
jgi:peptidoglycan LD-endopeptidase LytH